jgi:hypothetical protein
MGCRLPDVVEFVTRKFRETVNVVRNPGAVFRQLSRKKASQWYENQELPGKNKNQPQPVPSQTSNSEHHSVSNSNASSEVIPRARVDQVESNDSSEVWGDNDWTTHTISLLSVGERLSGSHWYSYTIESVIKDDQWVRVYQAQSYTDESVIMKEYILSDADFHDDDIKERQRAFSQLVNLNVNALNGPGEGRDFRLVRLVEAFYPKVDYDVARCYLVAKPLHGTSLRTYLQQQGTLRSTEVREVLHQVLQTLQFLHSVVQIRFSSTSMKRGIPHGNLSLDSLFIRQTNLAGINCNRKFFIHITDLLLWEHLIYPPKHPKFCTSVAQDAQGLGDKLNDLKALAFISFQLLGCTVDEQTGVIVGLHDGTAQEQVKDDPLYCFLRCLLNIPSPLQGDIKTSKEALEVLSRLPDHVVEVQPVVTAEPDNKPDVRSHWVSSTGLQLALLLTILFGIIAWFLLNRNNSGSLSTENNSVELNFNLASAPLNNKEFLHQVESGGVLEDVFQKNLYSSTDAVNSSATSVSDSIALFDEIIQRSSVENWVIGQRASATPVSSRFQPHEDVLQFIQESPNHIGFVRSTSNLPENLESYVIAHDALVAIVPFRDVYNRSGNIPAQLDGYISVEELRQIYTSDTLDSILLRGYPVQLYFPNSSPDNESYARNQETIDIFKETVLENDPELIQKFENLEQQARQRLNASISNSNQSDSLSNTGTNNGNSRREIRGDIYDAMFSAYDTDDSKDIVYIGFDRISRSRDQCTVYPLAIGQSTSNNIQTLYQVTGQPIDETIDICGFKGSLLVDATDYPLRYDLNVVYQSDSGIARDIETLFSSPEVQYLMYEIGLIPIYPVQELWNSIWRSANNE